MKEYYKTSDIDLASTLSSLGFIIDGIYAKEGIFTSKGEPQMEIYFEKSDNLIKTIYDYFDSKLLVEPLKLLGIRKEILNRLKDGTLYA